MNDLFAFLLGAGVAAAVLIVVALSRARRGSAPVQRALDVRPKTRLATLDDRTGRIVERVVEGVVVLEEDLRPALVNRSARRMLGIQEGARLDRLPSEEVIALARRAAAENREIDELVTIWFPTRRKLNARVSPLEGAGIMILLQDVTEEVLAQQVRREFVAHASHELKSPVASLQTLAEAVREAVADDPEAAVRFADRIAAESNRLGRLISDLLDLSRLEDPMTIPEETIDLSTTAGKEFDQIEGFARAKGVRLTSVIVPDVLVRGDDQQLGLMIRNLLENAVRYTPEGGAVELEVSRNDHQAIVKVSDTGIGIPLEAQGRVFERFYRVDRARSRDKGGTGLGLAIVKHVAELHGGGVGLESELGRGSIFTATLPALDPEEASVRSIAG